MQGFEETDFSKKMDWSLWIRLLKIAKPYRVHFLCYAGLMMLCALCDVAFPLLTGYAIDQFVLKNTTEGLGGFSAMYLLAVLLQTASITLSLYLAGKIEVGVVYLIRRLGFQKLQELPFSYYDRMPAGFLLSRMTTDSQRLGDTIAWSLIDVVWGGIFIVACSVEMLLLNWKLALSVIIVIPPLAVLSVVFQRKILRQQRAARKIHSKITSALNEGIMGARTSKTLVLEEDNTEHFSALAADMKKASVHAASLSAMFVPIVVSLGSVATAYALWRGGTGVLAVPQLLSVGMLQVFINYTVSFFYPIRDIAHVFAEMQSAQAAAERVLSLLATEP